uniref:Double-stranded RNA-binding protein Staufen homolog 1 n=1 Tax=Periophthalmus magnuspinnatus TaxID=409849 RepID=A0A3B4B2Q1_9GOBI
MSQMQFQCPASPLPAAPAPLPLGQQQQPGYSIPCASGTLQSESASQPGRSSALPAGSATAYNTITSNMANPKEKTPMCLVNELARFNKIQPEYKLLSEQGPAHSKIFSVRLTLGDQHWEAEGTSIKKAQHSAAAAALSETTLPKPTVRSPRPPGRIPDSMAHIIELNAICMKLGKKPMYKPLDPYPGMRSPNFNYNVRGPGPYQRSMQYYYPFPPVGPVIYHMELSVGGQQFLGKGRTRQLAKHDAAAKALKVLQKEPMLQELAEEEEEEENLNKSEISQVFEIALKRNLPVSFEQVLKEDGPPHMKSFVVRVTVGQFVGEGEGKSKKIAKKLAAAAVLGELKKLPHIPSVEKALPRIKKKTKSIIKQLQTSPEYGQGMNPISRLAQIQQAKKEKEPEYTMVTERGLPRRREFVMQVTVGGQSAEGMGPSKKVAKRNAAEKMLELLGYKVPQPQPPKPALKTDEKLPVKKPGDGRKVTFFEPGSAEEAANIKEEDFRLPYMSHQQLPAGILPMVPEVAQAVGVCQGPQPSRTLPNPAKATVTAMIANELLYAGTSPTAETILKNKNNLNQLPHGPLTRPSEQLSFLSAVQGLQVDYKDFPKNNKNEFVSLINCSAQPPLISHGIGKDVESCHDMAALNILKLLSELDQQANERTGNGPASCVKQEMEDDLKQANSNTLAHTLDGTA